MRYLGDIKNRVIIVDYPPGAHGHFIVETLHELVYQVKSLPHDSKNYHQSLLVPGPMHFGILPLDNVEIDLIVDTFLESNLPIFWATHWSNDWCWQEKPNNFANYHKGYKFLEIYVGVESLPQYFLNSVFNIGTTDRSLLLQSNYFIENFYKHINEIGLGNGVFAQNAQWNSCQDIENHKFTRQEVVELLADWLYLINQRPATIEDIPPRKTMIEEYNLHEVNVLYHLNMTELYSLDNFLKEIEQILDCFCPAYKLKSDDKIFLEQKWQRFYNNRIQHNIYNIVVPDDELHPMELAYRKFICRLS